LEVISRSAGLLKGKWGGIMKAGGLEFSRNLFNEKIRAKYIIGMGRLY
jgi:hypothetical protein